MLPKLEQQRRAIELRRVGHSLSEIARLLEVSKSSVSIWVRELQLSDAAVGRIEQVRGAARERAAATNRSKVDLQFAEARQYGESIVRSSAFNADARRVLCALLYWCEGTKIRRHAVPTFTNSDADLVATYLKLLRTEFKLDESRLRLTLHVHEYHDAQKQLRFWSNLTKIPLAQCTKPYRKPNSRKRVREGYQGCVSIRYLDTRFGRYLEGIAKAYLRKGP